MSKESQMFYEGTYTDFGVQPNLLEINIGSNLLSLVEEENKGPLVEEVLWLRNKLDDELGLVLPKVRVRDSSYLKPDEYALFFSGTEVAKSSVKIGYYLCLDTGTVTKSLDNTEFEKTKDPAYGMDGFIVPENELEKAKEAGYLCVTPEKIIRTHFYEIIRKNITKILNQSNVNEIVEKVRRTNPDVITDVFFTKRFSISDMKILLNRLLKEHVSIRDMNTILETIADYLDEEKKPLQLAEKVRERLAPMFLKEYYDEKNDLHVFKFSQVVEDYLVEHAYFPGSKVDKPYLTLDPADRKRMIEILTKCISWFNAHNLLPVFVCVSSIRGVVSDFIKHEFPDSNVFSDMEIYSVKDLVTVRVEGEVCFDDK